MSKILGNGGLVLLGLVVVVLVLLRFLGYEPRDQSPGLWVTGELVTDPVTDWSFTDDVTEIFVQTRSRILIPHSVTTYCTVHDGELYVFAAYYEGGTFPEERAWNRNVMRAPRARLKIGDRLYDRALRHVTDPALRTAVHASAEAKYPQWTSPGLQDVHMFVVS